MGLLLLACPLAAVGAGTSGRAPGPDLVVVDGSYGVSPADPCVGDPNVTVNFTILNIGNQVATGAFNVSFYLNDTSTPLAPDEHNNITVNGLAKDTPLNISCPWYIAGLVANVNYTIIIILDVLGTEAEADETNNNASVNQTLGPEKFVDLYPSAIALDPMPCYIGDLVTITVTVMNQGAKTSPYADVFFYLNNTTSPGIAMFNTTTEVDNVTGKNVTGLWDTSAVSEGADDIVVVVNPTWAVNHQNELNTSNNELRLPIVMARPPIALELVSFEITPVGAHAGDNVTANCTVLNNGTRAVNDLPAEFLHEDVSFNSANLTLGIGETTSLEATMGTTDLLAGNHTLAFVCGNINESRNFTLLPERLPDISVRNASHLPLAPKIGQSVVVTVQVANLGDAPSEPCNLSLTLDWNPTPLVTIDVPALQPTEVKSLQLTFDSTGMEARNHSLRVLSDSDNIMLERNESNNAMMWPIELVGEVDLSIQNLTITPGAPRTGDTITFMFNISNVGTLRCQGANLTLFVGGALACNDTMQALAAGGANTNRTLKWNTTGLSAGPYTYEVRISTINDTDINSTNDLLTGQVVLAAPHAKPDLRVRTVTPSPTQPTEGEDLELAISVENIGTADAGGSTLSVFLGSSRLTDPSIPVPAIAAGGATTVELTRTINFKSGTYTLNISVDFSQNIDELNETNNFYSTSITVKEPPAKVPVLGIAGIYPEKSPKANEEVSIDVVVSNTGDADAMGVVVTLIINGQTKATDTIPMVAKGSNGTAKFSYRFPAGTHTISARASVDGSAPVQGQITIKAVQEASEPNMALLAGGLGLLMLLFAIVAYRVSKTGAKKGPSVKLIEEEE